MFEHTVSFLRISYDVERLTVPDPIPESLWADPAYPQYFEQMGRQGWELVSVTPLLGGWCKTNEDVRVGRMISYGSGHTCIIGYYFFWKRST